MPGGIASSPADVSGLPTRTPAVSDQASRIQKQKAIPPQITPQPTSPENRNAFRLNQKRTITSTVFVNTVTVYVTSTVNVFSIISYPVTVSSSTTIWLTSTTVLNAQKTLYTATTTNLAKTYIVQISTQTTQTSQTSQGLVGSAGSNNRNGSGSSLSTGAKIGIGVGAGIGAIVLGLLLALFLRHRSKKRKAENQAMIDEAVAAAIASNPASSPQEKMTMSPYPIPSPSPTAFHTNSAQPGYSQYATPPMNTGGYHAHSPELPASPIQQPHELPIHPYSPPPPPWMGPEAYSIPYRG